MSASQGIANSTRSMGINLFFIPIIASLFGITTVAAQPPLGAPNEVWVDVPDTAYVGQEVELQVYMANSEPVGGFATSFIIYSPDGARWERVEQPDSEWNFFGDMNFISYVRGFRFWDYLELRMGVWGPVDSQSAAFQIEGSSLSGPLAPVGPLEHAYTMHIRPTETGTICIDSTMFWTADDQWLFGPGGDPAWNGPFCFTVVEPPIGDINCDGAGNLADAIYLINWIFKGGPEPCR
jgi:hypothetical protein